MEIFGGFHRNVTKPSTIASIIASVSIITSRNKVIAQRHIACHDVILKRRVYTNWGNARAAKVQIKARSVAFIATILAVFLIIIIIIVISTPLF
jgi:hypothetical protein